MVRVAVVLCLVACTPATPPASPTATTATTTSPVRCCASYEEVRALDGRKVEIVGVYDPIAVRKGPRDPADDANARTVSIRDVAGAGVMLGVYYAPSGQRSAEEIARFAHKRVRVVGTLHARTPEQVEGGATMQTMIGPCLTDIESIDAL